MGDLGFHLRFLILFAIDAYYSLLFLYIIVSILQSLAGMTIPEGLRPAANFVYDVSEPFLRLFRRLLPSVRLGGMGLDLSPILAFIVLAWIVRPVAQALLFPGS